MSIATMLDTEDTRRIDPTRSKEEQLAAISKIYPPHKEKLGVLVFELE